jgi:hypothetical protein
MHRDGRGFVTVALSAPADRPVVGGRPYADWLPFPGGGQMMFLRYLDSVKTWHESPFLMPRQAWWLRQDGDGQLQKLMKEYYPRGVYCSRARFEKNGCAA